MTGLIEIMAVDVTNNSLSGSQCATWDATVNMQKVLGLHSEKFAFLPRYKVFTSTVQGHSPLRCRRA